MTSGDAPAGRPGRALSPWPARRRSRPRVLAVLAAVVALGLVVTTQVPDPVGDVVGDLLYAVAVYAALVLVAPRLRPWVAGAVVLVWCWLVEILQATPVVAAVLDVVPAAAWVLGSTFNPRDLVLYLLGALLAVGLDVLVAVRTSRVSERA
ncbi:ribosomal maturation YjgA family protein [Oerskovia sp. USHLN155]|uniref:ribosomal maturation YjgA family protein n=1 Tax=Oerskovia sp. USHLN155 TaxID=3081288 RepID=UPI0030182B7E